MPHFWLLQIWFLVMILARLHAAMDDLVSPAISVLEEEGEQTPVADFSLFIGT